MGGRGDALVQLEVGRGAHAALRWRAWPSVPLHRRQSTRRRTPRRYSAQ
jgi:hypothetical protein